MSEANWANKYRPKTIDEVVGQPKIKRELEILNKAGKLPKSILLYGSSGVGKTTIAYLIAKLGKCENLTDEGKPCEECSNCQLMNRLIENGTHSLDLDVHAFNIAKLNKSEEADVIIQNMSQTNSFVNSKRYFILDEMQVATPQAQVRFLDITEKQPKGLYTVLCTTNPERLNEALKSRFISYKLQKPSVSEIVDRLSYICEQEGVNYTRQGLTLIVTKNERSVRKSILKAEELSSFGDLNKENIIAHFGTLNDNFFFEYINHIRNNNMTEIANMHSLLTDEGIEFQEFVQGLSSFFVDLIDISNLIQPDIYTKSEIIQYKSIFNGIPEYTKINMIRKLKEYYSETSQNKFIFYSLTTELMSIFNASSSENKEEIQETVVQTEQPEIKEELVNKKYQELSNQINDDTKLEVVEPRELKSDDLVNLFSGTVIDSND